VVKLETGGGGVQVPLTVPLVVEVTWLLAETGAAEVPLSV
jgi:hypothetical protein